MFSTIPWKETMRKLWNKRRSDSIRKSSTIQGQGQQRRGKFLSTLAKSWEHCFGGLGESPAAGSPVGGAGRGCERQGPRARWLQQPREKAYRGGSREVGERDPGGNVLRSTNRRRVLKTI